MHETNEQTDRKGAGEMVGFLSYIFGSLAWRDFFISHY